jgi:hypothetical protein
VKDYHFVIEGNLVKILNKIAIENGIETHDVIRRALAIIVAINEENKKEKEFHLGFSGPDYVIYKEIDNVFIKKT